LLSVLKLVANLPSAEDGKRVFDGIQGGLPCN
jgi:hypothetical protein